MRKRKKITEVDVQRWIRQGLGQGEGDSYRPWWKVRDVPSRGRSARVAGLKSARVHHLLSDIEFGHFLRAEYRPDTTQIREQVSLLPWDDTIEIASSMGYRHPVYRGTNVPIVITSDLLLDIERHRRKSQIVLCVKSYQELLPEARGIQRTIEKLSIERRYWQDRGVPWFVVTDRDLNSVVTLNLELLRPTGISWRNREKTQFARYVAKTFLDPCAKSRTFRRNLESFGPDIAESYEAFGIAVWRRWIPIDLKVEIGWKRPIRLTSD